MKIKTIIATIVIGLFVIGILSIFFSYYKKTPTGAVISEKEKITIAQTVSPKAALFIIAEKNGYYAEEGLEVDSKPFTAGRLALDALLSKDVQFANVADVPIMSAGFTEQKIVVISTIVITSNDIKVVARKDHGLSKPADLKDKKVAMFKGTSSEIFLYYFLKANNLNLKDIRVINLRPEEMPIALVRGDIDAYVIWEPFVYNGANLLGNKSLVFSNSKIYPYTFNVVINSDFALENPTTIKKFLRALLKAEDFIKNNRDESVKIVASNLGMDYQVLNKIWNDYDFSVSLDKTLITNLENDAQWALDSGLFHDTKIPNYRAMIYEKPLKEIKPQAVTI